MAVYVDDMEAEYRPKHRPGFVYVMCHMIADTEEELHDMAKQLGVARRWYQGDHYDIAKAKKALAISLGAIAITWRQCGMMSMNRRLGYPMGTPETCEEIAKQRRENGRASRNNRV